MPGPGSSSRPAHQGGRPLPDGADGADAADAETADRGGYQRIQAVDRAVALLKAVADSATPPTALELAQLCGLNRSTAWRLLRTLEYHGLVDRDAITQRYTVGYGMIPVASAVADDALVRRVRPLLEKLAVATGESVTLAVAKRLNLIYIDQVDPPHVVMPGWLGKPLPLHATSGGKAFLAWLSPDERAGLLPEHLPRYTDRTITSRDELDRELARVRQNGYALCVREYEEFSSGASAAVLSPQRYPMAVINIWGPAPRIPVRRLHEIGRETALAADAIAQMLDREAP